MDAWLALLMIPVVISLAGIVVMVSAYRRSKRDMAEARACGTSDGAEQVASPKVSRRRQVANALWMTWGIVLAAGPWAVVWWILYDWRHSDGWLKFGRALRIRRRTHLAAVGSSQAWGSVKVEPCGPAEEGQRRSLGEAWLYMARMEHASIPAFSLLSVALAAHGAPASLLRKAHAAGQDEIRHAEMSFAIAEALSGQARGPGDIEALQGRAGAPRSLAELAVESLVDGCLGEGVAAALAARGRSLATHPNIREALQRIAEDEQRHAELAWEVLEWCLVRGGAPVARLVSKAAEGLRVPGSLPGAQQPLPVEVLRQWGVPDAELVRSCGERCLLEVQTRVGALLRPRLATAA